MADLLNQIIPDVVTRSDQLWRAFWETIQMVSISGCISLVFGIPFGVLLFTTKEGGILQNRPVNFILGKICDFFRSIPFILLGILLIELSRLIVGTGIGVRGIIIPLLFATIPFLGHHGGPSSPWCSAPSPFWAGRPRAPWPRSQPASSRRPRRWAPPPGRSSGGCT